jgi:hypothetical protein
MSVSSRWGTSDGAVSGNLPKKAATWSKSVPVLFTVALGDPDTHPPSETGGVRGNLDTWNPRWWITWFRTAR